jgi:hypothetical protein
MTDNKENSLKINTKNKKDNFKSYVKSHPEAQIGDLVMLYTDGFSQNLFQN